ncbi:MAG: hypothetical protein IKG17_06320 [Mogibacterium sp.]|nr:hypothetical protein [Mogibacterium sp.]
MDDATALLILLAAGGAVVVVRYLLNVVADKGRDSVRNAYVRSKEANNPPPKERLADRYYGTPAGKSLNLPERPADSPVNTAERPVPETVTVSAFNDTEEQLLFCPYCGTNLSQMEKDDRFCPNCGAQLR